MQTLTYGRKKPEDGDKGSVFFPALADNIVLDDAHTHDGVNTPKISSLNLTRTTVAVTNSGWTPAGAFFTKSVVAPVGYLFASTIPMFLLNGGALAGNRIYPTYTLTAPNTILLQMPVNDQAVDVVFT